MTDGKRQSGLIRLKDLETLNVEEGVLFPKSESASGTSLNDLMAEEMAHAIRRTRNLHGDASVLDEPQPSMTPPSSPAVEGTPAGAPALPESASTSTVGQRPITPPVTHAETQAALREAEAEFQRRSSRGKLVWAVVIIALLGIIATFATLLLTRPPSLVQQSYAAYMIPLGNPARSQGQEIGVEEPPPPPVVPVLTPEQIEEQQREQERLERQERRERQRDREPEVDRNDLF